MGLKPRPLKPKPLKRREAERTAASHQAIQRATYQHLMALVNDPDRPGHTVTYGELEQRMRGRCYRMAAEASHTSTP